MKNIWKLLDEINAKRIRPFIKLSILIVLLYVGGYLIKRLLYNTTDVWNHEVLFSGFSTGVWAAVFLCLFLHLKRQRNLGKTGNIDRIRLLPINKRTYYLGEILFVFMTLCILLVGFIISAYSIFLIYSLQNADIASELVYLILLNSATSFIIPLTLMGVLRLVLVMIAVSIIITTLSISINASMVLITSFSQLFLASLIFFFLFNPLLAQNMITNDSILLIIICIVFDVLLLWNLDRLFKTGKIGG